MSLSKPLLSVVIPAYNEAQIILETLNKITSVLEENKSCYEIIVVENGSSDQTYTLASSAAEKNPKIKVYSQTLGNYGLALRRGMEESKGEIIINFDADYYDLDFLNKAQEMIQNGVELVIASKHIKGARDNRSFLRKFVSGSFNLILRIIFGLRVSDTHGIKAWKNTPLLKQTIRRTKGMSNIFDTELIIRLQKEIRIAEVPIEVKELRQARSGIIKRAFSTIFELFTLFKNLHFK